MAKVILEVIDGVVGIVENNDGVELEIRDYDWPSEDMPEDKKFRLMHNHDGYLTYEGEGGQ